MTTGTDSIKQLFEKYKFFSPIPEEIQNKIKISRDKTLKQILKETGSYTFYRYLIISVYLKFRGMGISLSVKKVNILVPSFAFASAGILIFLTAFILMPDLGRRDYYTNKGHAVFIAGDVKLKKSGLELKQLQLKDEISENDIIITGKDSSAAFQLGKSNLVYLKPESEIRFSAISSVQNTEVNLSMGKVLLKIFKTEKNSFYIKTLTCVVAVRGTEFSVSFDGKESVVALGRGNLEISHINHDKHILNEGNTAFVSDTYEVKPVSEYEMLDLKRIRLFTTYEKINDVKIEELKKTNSRLIEENSRIDEELKKIQKKDDILQTLDAIKQKYGVIQEISLFSGKILKGYVLERGAHYTIVIPGQIIRIKADEIENVRKI